MLYSTSLPTLDVLKATVSPELDAATVAEQWFAAFSKHIAANDIPALSALFIDDSYWRDMLALTWTFRTFIGQQAIAQFLTDRVTASGIHDLQLNSSDEVKPYVGFQQPYPDLAWIQGMFTFKTSDVGIGSGIFRLVPTSSGAWKAWTIFTNLENLQNFPEKTHDLRDPSPNHGKWEQQRQIETEFADRDPAVLVIGGGQSGLDIAARLKAVGIDTLVVEKNKRVGDNWRGRYKALCLHDPVWYDHMPYLPFPPTWPVYSPALKLANWLENYVDALELNVWTSAEVVDATQDASTNLWSVIVRRAGQPDRVFKVKHLVFAVGLGAGRKRMPTYPGMDDFKGQILHSTQHNKATDHVGKKVVIVGACTSAHDIAVDYHENGVDVTMYQRGSTYIMSTTSGWKILMEGVYSEHAPPVDLADRISASFPLALVGMSQRSAKAIAEADKGLLDGLKQRGFRLNMGVQDTGFGLLAWNHTGGYYLDTGGSGLIASGAIKLKNDSPLTRFTASGLAFEDGSQLPADVVVFATGYSQDARDAIRQICGDGVADKCSKIWGMNEEGELNGAWRPLGPQGLYYMMGNLALCRFHSKHVALQIKAVEEGVFGEIYK